MGLLNFSPARCVRALSINSICTLCVDICPTAAIILSERLPSLNQVQCVGCGGCSAVCPTEALAMDDFNPTDFFFAFINDESNLLSCQKNLPCLAALGSEQLIALCGMKKGLTMDIGHCAQCEIGEKILSDLVPRVENVNYALEAIDSPSYVEMAEVNFREDEGEEVEHNRRDFFKTFHLKKIGAYKANFEREVQLSTDEFISHTTDSTHTQALRTKKITDRRKLFFTALKRLEKPSFYHVVEGEKIGFTSQKLFDESKCTACEMCYRICPTGALTSDMRNSKIDFDPFLCVKCHLCHDVCESDAITLSPSYNLKEWFEPIVHNLVTYSLRRCNECDTLFSSVGGDKICRRCRLEEEEALELWGLNS
ncbi:4Fe-4S binding protein [Sulfuricurvum sp.]|uniref:4Fe-4S binding protein n=1 Tax=Sulfuricurvum sp. TaxID=2025608 RepID=UPI003565DE71